LQTVVAGADSELEAVLASAIGAGLEPARLNVSHGFHSPAMHGVPAPFAQVLAGTEFAEPDLELISTVTGQAVPPEADLTGLLARQLVEPVRFTQALRALADRCELLVEAGPGHTLSGLARDSV